MAEEINISLKDSKNAPPATACLLRLYGQVIYPHSIAPVVANGQQILQSDKAMESNRMLAAFSEMPSAEELKVVQKCRGILSILLIKAEHIAELVHCAVLLKN